MWFMLIVMFSVLLIFDKQTYPLYEDHTGTHTMTDKCVKEIEISDNFNVYE